MPSLYLRLAGAAAALLLVAGLAAGLYHRGYVAGEAAKVAFYAPILKAAQDAATAAQARAKALEGASAAISADIEARHADTEKALTQRAADAHAAMLGSLRALAAARGRCPMPGVPGSPAITPGAAPGPDRPDAVAGRIAATGRSCEHDAAELAGWLDWYAKQKALATSR